MQLFDRAIGGDFAKLVVLQEPASGLRAIVALHDLRRGPAFGGIRRLTYTSDEAALGDALALAQAMSRKLALAGMPAGGGKTVMVQGHHFVAAAAYKALALAIEQLAGHYYCGPDLGTGDQELEWMRPHCAYVNPPGNRAGDRTAQGVLAGLRGLLAAVTGKVQISGLRVAIEGLGQVGSSLALSLIQAGATVFAYDCDRTACLRAQQAGVQIVLSSQQLLAAEVDVFMPCAVGGTLTRSAIESLRAWAICGSANNPLDDATCAARLHHRGILYAPDFVVNAGAVIEGVISQLPVFRQGSAICPQTRIEHEIAAIEARTCDLLRAAKQAEAEPLSWAIAHADACLAGKSS